VRTICWDDGRHDSCVDYSLDPVRSPPGRHRVGRDLGPESPGYRGDHRGRRLVGAVLAAVYHAEVIAHRVGEPFGSLVLAVAVTVIEVALIVTMMVTSGEKSASLARDTYSPR